MLSKPKWNKFFVTLFLVEFLNIQKFFLLNIFFNLNICSSCSISGKIKSYFFSSFEILLN